ncbi:MAG: hypothetical protein AAGF89_09890, partial [Bacteroidota bacterium]
PPPPPPPFSEKVTARILNVFKGQTGEAKIIIASDLSSCGWLPAEGKKYLLYLSTSDIAELENQKDVFWVGACSRKLLLTDKEVDAEKEILRVLATKNTGLVYPKQKVLSGRADQEYHPFRGELKDGQRHGDWLLYPPVFWVEDRKEEEIDYTQPIFLLEYNHGKLVGARDLVEGRTTRRRRYLLLLRAYYEWGM